MEVRRVRGMTATAARSGIAAAEKDEKWRNR